MSKVASETAQAFFGVTANTGRELVKVLWHLNDDNIIYKRREGGIEFRHKGRLIAQRLRVGEPTETLILDSQWGDGTFRRLEAILALCGTRLRNDGGWPWRLGKYLWKGRVVTLTVERHRRGWRKLDVVFSE